MKTRVCFAVMVLMSLTLSAQDLAVPQPETKPAPTEWSGQLRFNPMFTGLVLGTSGGFALNSTFVAYVDKHLGIPVELGCTFVGNSAAFTLLSGLEAIPLGTADKNGLFLSGKAGAGLTIVDDLMHFELKGGLDLGYQFITEGGFVFIPAVGLRTNGLDVGLNLMLDVGFAW